MLLRLNKMDDHRNRSMFYACCLYFLIFYAFVCVDWSNVTTPFSLPYENYVTHNRTHRIGTRPSFDRYNNSKSQPSHKNTPNTINCQNDCNLAANRKRLSIVDSIKIRVEAKLEDVTVELQNDKRSIAVLEVGWFNILKSADFHPFFLRSLSGSKSNK